MRVIIVCGGRDYHDQALVTEVLDRLHAERPIDWLRQGGATGADQLAHQWARSHHVNVETHNADWKSYGKRAGPLRNAQMLSDEPRPSLVVAFPGGRGTDDMCRQAKAAGVSVLRVERL